MSSLKKTYTNIVTAKHKNLKPVYYLKNFLKLKILPQFTHNKLDKKLKKIKKFDINYIQNRVNYYNKLENETALKKSTGTLQEFIFDGKEKTYFLTLGNTPVFLNQNINLPIDLEMSPKYLMNPLL